MLISYQSGFCFIHIEKAAGSSIQDALRRWSDHKIRSRLRRRLTLLGPLNRVGGLYKAVQFSEHAVAREVQECLPPEVYASLFKFAFVRNPWDRLVSRQAHLLRSTDRRRHSFVSRMENFEEFIKWEIERGAFQSCYVTDEKGIRIVDFIGYYEMLNEDFAKVCAQLKIQAELPHANISQHKDYRTYYTPKTRDLVAAEFKRDIEMFGYTFDGLA